MNESLREQASSVLLVGSLQEMQRISAFIHIQKNGVVDGTESEEVHWPLPSNSFK